MKLISLGATLLLVAIPAFAQLTVTGFQNTSVSVTPGGLWTVTVPTLKWTFTGSVGAAALAPHVNQGTDSVGSYQEIAFNCTLNSASRTESIRIYDESPVVLFNVVYNSAAANSASFPAIATYPQTLSHLSFNGEFAGQDFTNLVPSSPWAYFDGAGNTFILSPAANFMTAETSRLPNGSITGGISPKITTLPAGFTHSTSLVFGAGINNTFQTWGLTLTELRGKKRPGNDEGALLNSISYWTDNGATYYYNPGSTSYVDTLNAISKEFSTKGIQLGSLQLDSWWYPKGPDNSWSSHSGIWTYTASPALFPEELVGFEAEIRTPLITHARWVDANSPYRSQYAMSAGVATDPKYWEMVADYLKTSGVTTYEQDWLGDAAQASFNLTDSDAFLSNMAASTAARGISIQYCMALPQHFLQSANYSNVTTIRVSQDRFQRSVWSNFLYSSRLASALGVWPFADAFMSSETSNLIAATLSAGPVGVGDPMGQISSQNLLKAVRADGVIVKPDVPMTPVDSVFQSDAQGIDVPMLASTYTDFGAGLRTWYLFAYVRGSNATVAINPASYGIPGDAYLYDSLHDSGRLISANTNYTFDLIGDTGFYILAPVGKSGMAILGDKGQFVSLGKKRVPALSDDGKAQLTVSFAPGESTRTIFGYSPTAVSVTALAGRQGESRWNPASQMFMVNVHPTAGAARLQITANATAAPIGCLLRCGDSARQPD